MNLTSIEKQFNGTGRPVNDTVSVEIKMDDHSFERVGAHYRSYERTWMKNSLTPTFTGIDLTRYIYTLFQLRCQSQVTSLKQYTKQAKRIKIPSLIYLVLEQLGYVQIKELGLTITPIFIKDERHDDLVMTPEELDKLSFELQELENLGHEMARGIPMDDGSQEFMLMEVIEGKMCTSDPKSHPVYAFLKSFIVSSSLDDFIKSRIYWLERDEYAIAYDTLVRSRND